MRYLSGLILILVVLSPRLLAVDAPGLMTRGNAAYESGDFPAAIAAYEKILASDLESAEVYYNLGCAYFSEASYGRAILNFEKARQLSPRDPDVVHNLEYSKLFLKDRFDLPEQMLLIAWFKNIRSSLSLTELKQLEQILFLLLMGGIILTRFLKGHRLSSTVMTITIILAVLFAGTGGWLLDRVLSLDEKRAILLVDQTEVSSAPLSGSNTLFVIHEGTSGKILDATDSWYEIRLDDGKTGWIPHEVVGLY